MTQLNIIFLGTGFYLFTGILLAVVIPKYLPSYLEVINTFWILGLLIVIQPTSYLIGTGVLLVNNFKRQYIVNLYISTIVYLVLIGICFQLNIISIFSTANCLVVSAIVGLMSNIFVCYRKKILNWVI